MSVGFYNLYRPDMTFAVDCAFKTNYLYLFLLYVIRQQCCHHYKMNSLSVCPCVCLY